MVRVVFTPIARRELASARRRYLSETEELGTRFGTEAKAVVDRIRSRPLSFPLIYRNIRRALFEHFPYALMFVEQRNVLIVVACFHGSRDPIHWQKRI